MTKIDVAKAVAAAAGVPLPESRRLVELVLRLIIKSLQCGKPVMIAGFGKFSVRQKQARRVVQFRASPLLKLAVADAGQVRTDCGSLAVPTSSARRAGGHRMAPPSLRTCLSNWRATGLAPQSSLRPYLGNPVAPGTSARLMA